MPEIWDVHCHLASPLKDSTPEARLGRLLEVADRMGITTGYALDNLQLRAELFVAPGEQVYEGMVIGEASRPGDMVVNAVREKEKTNIRNHSHDDGPKWGPPREHT